MPEWFEKYLRGLDAAKALELRDWLEMRRMYHMDDMIDAMLDAIGDPE